MYFLYAEYFIFACFECYRPIVTLFEGIVYIINIRFQYCTAHIGYICSFNSFLRRKKQNFAVLIAVGTRFAGDISELHLSAASEAMNQMMGASATSLSMMLGVPTDISTPIVNKIDVDSVKIFEKSFETEYEFFVKIAFRITIGDLIDSVMVQLYPVQFAREMCAKFLANEAES